MLSHVSMLTLLVFSLLILLALIVLYKKQENGFGSIAWCAVLVKKWAQQYLLLSVFSLVIPITALSYMTFKRSTARFILAYIIITLTVVLIFLV